jgi:S-formylglutathione hydrolase FrmB
VNPVLTAGNKYHNELRDGFNDEPRKLGRANGIECAIVAQPGKHDWPFASRAFAEALPWLAGQLGTPEVRWIPLPSV